MIAARHMEQPKRNFFVHPNAYNSHHARYSMQILALVRVQRMVLELPGKNLTARVCLMGVLKKLEGSIPAAPVPRDVGAGAPCPACNKPDDGEVPRMPRGFRDMSDKEDGS
ncbi:hypothetical protein [Bradyrhizobium sp. LTSPM299]|uniref:hypothetical protein n=1 Tax=Bradyrhizobium sp. LTSPM299 TaxID=1619233 RepID=UPI0012E1CED8|nr:hypothetical protein [Bradyrhizobium sp. LTSPM299]